jgi:hypothetical protein
MPHSGVMLRVHVRFSLIVSEAVGRRAPLPDAVSAPGAATVARTPTTISTDSAATDSRFLLLSAARGISVSPGASQLESVNHSQQDIVGRVVRTDLGLYSRDLLLEAGAQRREIPILDREAQMRRDGV